MIDTDSGGNNSNLETTKQIPPFGSVFLALVTFSSQTQEIFISPDRKMSLECCSEQSVSSMTDFCGSKMFFQNINLHHGLPPSHLKDSGSLAVMHGHLYCSGAILRLAVDSRV